jgi:NADPH-dependent 2,4-dienoyl-CoA reductase/sulfur reductase-like enzyme
MMGAGLKLLASRPVRSVVIVGMGYIGMEMAEALRAQDIAVTMVKPRQALLPWLASELVARYPPPWRRTAWPSTPDLTWRKLRR